MNVCILMCRTCVAGSGVCGCVMIQPTSTFIPLLMVLSHCWWYYPTGAGTIPLLVVCTLPLLLVLSPCCWWYYPPAAGTIPLLLVLSPCIIPLVIVPSCTKLVRAPLSPWFVLSCSTILYPTVSSPWWWCGQRCLYDHLSSTDLIAHQPPPAPDRLIVSQEHQFSVLFWTPLPSTIFNHI